MQRERRNADDQRVVPPFQKKHIEEMDVDSDSMDDTTFLFVGVTSHTPRIYFS
jgi:hypothetical protein